MPIKIDSTPRPAPQYLKQKTPGLPQAEFKNIKSSSGEATVVSISKEAKSKLQLYEFKASDAPKVHLYSHNGSKK